MSSTIHLPPTTQRWLRDCPLTPYVMGYFDHLIQCRYAAETTEHYMAGIAHLGLWMAQSHLAIEQLDERRSPDSLMSIYRCAIARSLSFEPGLTFARLALIY